VRSSSRRIIQYDTGSPLTLQSPYNAVHLVRARSASSPSHSHQETPIKRGRERERERYLPECACLCLEGSGADSTSQFPGRSSLSRPTEWLRRTQAKPRHQRRAEEGVQFCAELQHITRHTHHRCPPMLWLAPVHALFPCFLDVWHHGMGLKSCR
jgi:hypothetical protein